MLRVRKEDKFAKRVSGSRPDMPLLDRSKCLRCGGSDDSSSSEKATAFRRFEARFKEARLGRGMSAPATILGEYSGVFVRGFVGDEEGKEFPDSKLCLGHTGIVGRKRAHRMIRPSSDPELYSGY
jgi:hypothetical protein